MSRENTPERLAARIAQSEHNLAEVEKRKLARAAGTKEWAEKHSRHAGLPIRRDGAPARNKTDSNYPLFDR